MRKIFLDCGAHDGCSVEMFVKNNSDYNEYEIFSFECNQNRFELLKQRQSEFDLLNFHPSKKAVWINDGKKIFDGWGFTDTKNSHDTEGVECIDLSTFILENFDETDHIVLKLDIEGAEYQVVDKMHRDGSLKYVSEFYGELHGPKRGYSISDNNDLLKKIESCGLTLLNWDALEGGYSKTEIVPFGTKYSYKNNSSGRVGHAYRTYMDKITFCIPSKSNLRYLQTCIPSIRNNAYRKDHDIIVFVDSDEDGTVEWLEQNAEEWNVKYLVNPDLGNSLYGIGEAYDYCIRESETDVVMIFHADMMLGKDADFHAFKHLTTNKSVVCSTRIEPPIHPNAGEKILEDFGMWPEDFKSEEFGEYVIKLIEDNSGKTTDGIFAPWMVYKEEFLSMGGHDPIMKSAREDSDVFNRMKLDGFTFVQPWDSLVYHLTGRGGQFQHGKITQDHQQKSEEWQRLMANSTKEFIRKWNGSVNHTPLMHPVVSPRYDMTLVVHNCDMNLLATLEPWCDQMYLTNTPSDVILNYINNEQPNTLFDLSKKIHTFDGEVVGDIIIEFDKQRLTQQSFNMIMMFSDIIKDSGEIGSFELDIFNVTINKMEEIQNKLIGITDNWYTDKLLETK